MRTSTRNEVHLTARLSKEGELKTFPTGGSITKLIVCTEHLFKDKDGQWQTQPEFHTVIIRGHKAKAAAHLKKGKMVEVNGRLKTRSYEVNGEKRYTTEVVACEVLPVEKQPDQGERNFNVADDWKY